MSDSSINTHLVKDLYAYRDYIDNKYGANKEAWEKGDPWSWGRESGKACRPMYEWAKPDMLLRNEPRLRLEDIHLEMVARSAYRLAAIMNSVVK